MKYKACLLGAPELFVDGHKVLFPFQKAKLLAFILIEAKSIRRDKLCEYLWPDKELEKGRRNLSNALSCVRTLLPVQMNNREVVSIKPSVYIARDIDLLPSLDRMPLSEIVKINGTFMDIPEAEDLESFSCWLLPKRQHYHDLFVEGLRKRAKAFLERHAEDSYDEALECYELLAEREPYNEKIHGELVRLYIKTGRKVKAIDAAHSFSKRIESDLGISSDLADISSLIQKRVPMSENIATVFDDTPLSRSSEILKMLDFITSAESSGASSCGLIWGENGIGKTEFINELVSCLNQVGWECYYVRCTQEEKDRPMVPFIQLLQRLKCPLPQSEDITSLTELNYSRIAELVRLNVAAGEDNKKRLLVVENVHWMDDASWMILETIMWDYSTPLRLIISGFEEIRPTFMLRTTFESESFEKLEIELKRFDLEDTGQICRIMAPNRSWSEKDINNIYMQTEGNPFFIKEILKSGLPVRDGIDNISNNPFISIIKFLDKEERLFLEAIAIKPDHASMVNISEVLDISPLQLSIICENIKNNALIKESNNDEGDVIYYFNHMKIREALLENMSVSRKQALHLKNIEVLENGLTTCQYGKREIYSLLYFHAHEAGLAEKELYWRTMELKQNFRAAHEVFPTLTDYDLLKYVPTLEDMGHTELALSEADKLMDRIMRTSEQTPELKRIERDLQILHGALLWWSGEYEDAYETLRDGLRKALKNGETENIIEACVQLCFLAIQNDDVDRLSTFSNQLYLLSKKEHYHKWMGVSLRFKGISAILKKDYNRANRMFQMSTLIFEKLEKEGESYTACIVAAEHFRGDSKLAEGKVEEALSCYLTCINIGESIGIYRGLGLSLAKAAFCHILTEEYNDAEKLLLRMEKLSVMIHSQKSGGLQGAGIGFSLMGLLNAKKRDWDQAISYYSMADKFASETKRATWQAFLYWSKISLNSIEDIPKKVSQVLLNKNPEWYRKELEIMKLRIGWKNDF